LKLTTFKVLSIEQSSTCTGILDRTEYDRTPVRRDREILDGNVTGNHRAPRIRARVQLKPSTCIDGGVCWGALCREAVADFQSGN